MTARAVRRRGSPVAALAMVMLAWIGVRTATWFAEHPPGPILPRAQAKLVAAARPTARHAEAAVRLVERKPLPAVAQASVPVWQGGSATGAAPALAVSRRGMVPAAPAPDGAAGLHGAAQEGARTLHAPVPVPPAVAWQPGLAKKREAAGASRWSADAWLLVRGGGDGAALGPAAATYGATQAGAVLRYRLAPGSRHRPAAYVRATAALNGSGEREAALGLSARPLAALPLVVAAEGRVTHAPGRTVLRPAVLAYTEVPPIALPASAQAELYLQGGYVGGAGATPFVDGQLRIDRRVAKLGAAEFRAGGGIWGGAQRGAGRLDLGPSASLTLLGEAGAARIGFDWRFRIAGAAEPTSGPALTVSAGF